MSRTTQAKNGDATQEATAVPAKRFRLAYNPPWLAMYPTAAMFLLLTYLAFGTTTDATGTQRLLPDYIASYASSRTYMREAATTGTAPNESPLLNALLFFEEYVVGFVFQLGIHIFQTLFGIQLVCVGAWLIHIFELGMCVRICFSCNAPASTTALYMLCTALAGVAQLVPLTAARNDWLAKVKAAEKTTDAAPKAESKKKK